MKCVPRTVQIEWRAVPVRRLSLSSMKMRCIGIRQHEGSSGGHAKQNGIVTVRCVSGEQNKDNNA